MPAMLRYGHFLDFRMPVYERMYGRPCQDDLPLHSATAAFPDSMRFLLAMQTNEVYRCSCQEELEKDEGGR